MFTAGIGQLDGRHTKKGEAEKGMWVVKIGGPAYRIGMGGGAASSKDFDTADTAARDFDAVQRGDAEMENKMNRIVRACVERGGGANNPIVSIHDQGAGGNGNVLKEISEPAGAVLDVTKIKLGDETMSVLEIWGAEYQENNALLLRDEDKEWWVYLSSPLSLLSSFSPLSLLFLLSPLLIPTIPYATTITTTTTTTIQMHNIRNQINTQVRRHV